MAKLDIYISPSSSAAYLLDLQDELFDTLSTRVVAPMVATEDVDKRMKTLNPVIRFEGTDYILMTHLLAAIPITALKKKVGSAASQRDEIIASLDFLFTGI
jgi:toxin CcdB